jgi:hypothetical protein
MLVMGVLRLQVLPAQQLAAHLQRLLAHAHRPLRQPPAAQVANRCAAADMAFISVTDRSDFELLCVRHLGGCTRAIAPYGLFAL